MKIKNVEVITIYDQIKKRKKGTCSSFLHSRINIKNLRPQRYPYLYFDSLGDYKIFCNFSKGKGMAILNQPAADILNFCDGKKEIKTIFDIFSSKKKEKLNLSSVWSLGKKEISLKKAFKKLKEDKRPLTLNELKRIIFLFEKVGLIHSLEINQKEKLKRKVNTQNPFEVYFYLDRMTREKGLEAIDSIFNLGLKENSNLIFIRFFLRKPDEFLTLKELIIYSRKKSIENFIDFTPIIFTSWSLIDSRFIKEVRQLRARVVLPLDEFKKRRKKLKFLEKEKFSPIFVITLTTYNLNNIKKTTRYLLRRKFSFIFGFIPKHPLIPKKLIPENDELIRSMDDTFQVISKKLPRLSLFSNILGRNFLLFRDGKAKRINSLLVYRKGDSLEIKRINFKTKITPNCKNCLFRELCWSSYPVITRYFSPSLNNLNDYCEVYQNLIPKALRLEAKRLIKYKANQL